MKALAMIFAVFVSIFGHFWALSLYHAPSVVGESGTSQATIPLLEEIAAVQAFEALDRMQDFETDHEIALSALADFEPVLPEQLVVARPLSRPKLSPSKKAEAAPKPQAKPNQGNKPQKEQSQTQKSSPTAQISQAAREQAKQEFALGARRAIAKKIRVPKNVSGLQASLSLRFQNGRLQSFHIARSSGHEAFDQAILAAVNSARFPKPSSALPADVVFSIPLSVN